MKKIRVKSLFILIVGLLTLAGVLAGAHRLQTTRIAAGFRREAENAQADGRSDMALDYLRRYAEIAPQDNDGLADYGIELAKQGQVEQAYYVLEKALRRDGDLPEARRQLVLVAIQRGRFSEAISNIDMLLKDMPDDFELMDLKAKCHIALRQYDAAQDVIKELLAADPHRLDAYCQLADLQRDHLESPAAAAISLDQMVANNPTDGQAYLRRGLWRIASWKTGLFPSGGRKPAGASANATREEQIRQIAADAEQARALLTPTAELLGFSARACLVSGDLAKAREFAQQALSADSAAAESYLVLAEIEIESRNESLAQAVLMQGVQAVPGDTNLLWNLANLLIDRGREEDVPGIIQQLEKAGASEEFLGYLEGRLAFARRNWLGSVQKLEAVRPRMSDWPGLMERIDLTLGAAYGEIGARDQQMKCLHRAVEVNPFSIAARLEYAKTLQAVGQWRPAADEYRRILVLPAAPLAVRGELARCLCRLGMKNAATDRDWKEFDELVRGLEEQAGTEPLVQSLRIERSVAQRRVDEALSLARSSREQAPDDIERWNREISLALLFDDSQPVEQTLTEAERHLGDHPTLRIQQGRRLVRYQPKQADEQLKVLSRFPADWPDEAQQSGRKEFALLFLAVGDLEEAHRLASSAAAAAPADLSIPLILFEIAWQKKQPEAMLSALDQIRQIAGENADWHYGQGLRLSLNDDSESLRQARRHLDHARGLRPNWPRASVVLAELALKQQEQHTAIEHLLEAINQGERTPAVLSRAVALLCQEQRYVEADQVIRKLQETNTPLSSELIRSASDISLRLNNPARAVELAQQFADRSHEEQDVVWYAQMLGSTGKTEEAEALLRPLVERDKTNPEPWVALIQVLIRGGKQEQALSSIVEAEKAIAAGQAEVAIAQCYEMLGDNDLALLKFQAAMDKSPDDRGLLRLFAEFLLRTGRRSEVTSVLRRLMQVSQPGDPRNRDWAAQNLAVILANTNQPQDLQESLRLIETVAYTPNSSVRDQRLRAAVLARSPQKADRQQALQILEQLVKDEQHDVSEDRLLLANLYQLEGSRSRSREELRKLISVRGDNPRYLTAYIDMALQSGEVSEAEIWLNRLAEAAPEGPVLWDYQSRVQFARQRYAEALELLKKCAERNPTDQTASESQDAVTIQVAKRCLEWHRQLLNAGKDEPAEQFRATGESLLKNIVAQHPEENLLLAEFYAGTSQIDLAIDLLQSEARTADPARIVSVVEAIRRNRRVSQPQYTRLQEMLKALNAERPIPVLVLLLADLLNYRGEYRAAAGLYRDVLRAGHENIAAMNNLAILLALSGGDCNEAAKLIQRALDLGGPRDILLDSRGLVHFGAGDFSQAAADFEDALKVSDSPIRNVHLAAAYGRMRQAAKARQAFDRAVKLGFDEEQLHPLERPMFESLKSWLAQSPT